MPTSRSQQNHQHFLRIQIGRPMLSMYTRSQSRRNGKMPWIFLTRMSHVTRNFHFSRQSILGTHPPTEEAGGLYCTRGNLFNINHGFSTSHSSTMRQSCGKTSVGFETEFNAFSLSVERETLHFSRILAFAMQSIRSGWPARLTHFDFYSVSLATNLTLPNTRSAKSILHLWARVSRLGRNSKCACVLRKVHWISWKKQVYYVHFTSSPFLLHYSLSRLWATGGGPLLPCLSFTQPQTMRIPHHSDCVRRAFWIAAKCEIRKLFLVRVAPVKIRNRNDCHAPGVCVCARVWAFHFERLWQHTPESDLRHPKMWYAVSSIRNGIFPCNN